VGLATALATAAFVGAATDAVQASADGCTGTGVGLDFQCIEVTGSGRRVRHTQVAYNWATLKPSFDTPQICNSRGRWEYRKNGANGLKYSDERTGCVWGSAWFNWSPNTDFDDGSQFCGSTRTSKTGGRYPSPACVKIKA
jgi:hypothetical protein